MGADPAGHALNAVSTAAAIQRVARELSARGAELKNLHYDEHMHRLANTAERSPHHKGMGGTAA